MTEDEAKTKWCPATRFVPETEGHRAFDNRGYPFDPMSAPGRCIASDCMAWRWGEPESGHVVERRPARSGSSRPEGEGWSYAARGENPQGGPDWVRREIIRSGFCGLAGSDA